MSERNLSQPRFEHLLEFGRFNGTHLVGHLTTTYRDLVATFGQPTHFAIDDKTTAEWGLIFEDGTVATIYDYYTEATPLGTYEWHVGGRDRHALELVAAALGQEVAA